MYEAGAEGSGPDGLLATEPSYGGIDWGSDRGPDELRAIIALIVLSV